MNRPARVEVTEVGPRDGLQAEAEFVPTETKINLINDLIAAGMPRIEFSSFVSPRAVPQLVDVVDVFDKLDRSTSTILAALVPNAKGAVRAAECGVDEIIVFLSASESHNLKNVNRSVDESLSGFEHVAKIADHAGIPVNGAIATAFGCPFEGDVPVAQLEYIARHYRDFGFSGLTLGDTTGMATPPIVQRAVRHLRQAVPELPIGLHFHNTRGIGLVNVVAGLDDGIDRFDASFGGIGGCPFAPKATGNICTEDLVYLLHEMGIETGIDLERLSGVACDVETVIGRDLPGQVMKAGPRLKLHPMSDVATAVG
jgi:hydroxymethylglutaryl-CoA lyase